MDSKVNMCVGLDIGVWEKLLRRAQLFCITTGGGIGAGTRRER